MLCQALWAPQLMKGKNVGGCSKHFLGLLLPPRSKMGTRGATFQAHLEMDQPEYRMGVGNNRYCIFGAHFAPSMGQSERRKRYQNTMEKQDTLRLPALHLVVRA